MDVQSGLVIGAFKPRHRAREFIAFLRRIDRCVQRQLDVHVVLDNSSTHKTPEVKAWLEKHDRSRGGEPSDRVRTLGDQCFFDAAKPEAEGEKKPVDKVRR